MYTPGKLIYFDPFYFKNGESKRKYFLVLKTYGHHTILASLPSSIFHLPQSAQHVYGCIEMPEICVSCYAFKAGVPVTEDGWCFPVNTFLYGQWIDEFDIQVLSKNHNINNVDYEIIGEIKKEELQKIIDCFATSNNVKRKFKRLLSE